MTPTLADEDVESPVLPSPTTTTSGGSTTVTVGASEPPPIEQPVDRRPPPPIAFVDTETMGLDLAHDIWEVAVIRDDVEHVWQLQVNLKYADPEAAKINGFHDRYDPRNAIHPRELLENLRIVLEPTVLPKPDQQGHDLQRVHLAGAVVSFDEERLRKLWREAVLGPVPWHYHLIDVENLAVGYLRGKADWDGGQWKSWHGPNELDPPWESEAVSAALGIEPTRFGRHTALGDARWAKAIYEKVMTDERH